MFGALRWLGLVYRVARKAGHVWQGFADVVAVVKSARGERGPGGEKITDAEMKEIMSELVDAVHMTHRTVASTKKGKGA